MMNRVNKYLLTAICVPLLCAAIHANGAEQRNKTIPDSELPRIVAILPFQNETTEKGIENQVRKTFYNHFSSKSYRDIELPVVDEKIIHLEKSSGKGLLELSPEAICESIGCDGLIYGKVTGFNKVYAAVYSQFSVEAEVWMVNVKTKKEVFRFKDSVTYHGGSIPLSPIGLVMSAISAAINLRDIQQMRIVNELCNKLNDKIPAPEGIAAEDRPTIKEVITNAAESPFGKGKIIRVGLEGDKGMVAGFDIGNFKKGVPMKEIQPGLYTGEYVVLPGDNTQDMPVISYLKKPGGLESQWIDAIGTITIDTIPPPAIKGLKAKGFQDRVELVWESLNDTPDLKGYVITRSEQPLSGYIELARVEHNRFDDRATESGLFYYYRVSAVDHAGNVSDTANAVKGRIIPEKPEEINGELKQDTVLLGNYTVKGVLEVPKGISLIIEPGTNVYFDEQSSILVRGLVRANGKDDPIELAPSGDKGWMGMSIDSGEANLSGLKIRGAEAGLTLINAKGIIENAIITANGTGIYIAGIPSAIVKNSHISGNKKGIFLQKTDANIFLNTIVQNEEGIVIEEFSGEIRDNTIMDNKKNILALAPARIGINYFGTINAEEMKVEGATIQKAYDARPPEGKIVDIIFNPYTTSSQQERQEKATALVTEGQKYFGQRNYGKASGLFEESLRASPTPDAYYYLALCYQEMKEDERALKFLKEGAEKYPKDIMLQKALGMMYYQKGNEEEAKKVFENILRLSPEDRQIQFLLERMKK